MSELTVDFPLILVGLVFGSGLLWTLDAIFLAPGRKRLVGELQAQFPRWNVEGSPDAGQYQATVAEKAKEPVVVEYARSFFPVLLIVFVLRSFLVEPFQIPSSSMVPTLQVGDYILVNKFTYGIRLPVIRTKILSLNEPQRGDVMVFFPPHMNDTYFIKRVVGLPGDTVTYRDKQLYINGAKVEREAIDQIGLDPNYAVYEEALGDSDHLMQIDNMRRSANRSEVVKPGHYFIKRVVGLPGDTVTYRDKQLYINGAKVEREAIDQISLDPNYAVYEEALGDSDHLMQIDNMRRSANRSEVVKPGHYFMMGDNRDNSSDSRVWGQVPEKDIVGKAFAIWMHWDNLVSIPSFNRVGLIE